MTSRSVKGHEAETETVVMTSFGCDRDLAGLMVRLARFTDYPARSAIVRQGAANDHVHLLTRGKARKVVTSVDGRTVVIEDYGVGDLFGEAGLLSDGTAQEDICAVNASRAGAFENHVFVGLMSSHAAVALEVSRRLVARLGQATRRLAESTTLTASGRIHAELLRRARAEHAASGEMAIRPAPVLAQFALDVHSTRETVSRAINALEKRGVIKRTDDALIVVAPHRLEELIY